jgi:hypothetical protein
MTPAMSIPAAVGTTVESLPRLLEQLRAKIMRVPSRLCASDDSWHARRHRDVAQSYVA